MNIVVAMKQIPDLQQIRIRNRQPVLDGAPFTFGIIDRNALEAGVRIKEEIGGKVIIVSAGDEELDDTVKEALAAGADEAVLVIDSVLNGAESSFTAKILAEVISKLEDVDLILFGEGSGDNYSGQVGSRVAELLGLPQVGYVKSIVTKDNNLAQITRSLEHCDEQVEVELPAVVTVIADINQPRIPSVSQILKAGKKPRNRITPEQLNLERKEENKVVTISNLAPVNERKQVIIKSVQELVGVLQSKNLIRR